MLKQSVCISTFISFLMKNTLEAYYGHKKANNTSYNPYFTLVLLNKLMQKFPSPFELEKDLFSFFLLNGFWETCPPKFCNIVVFPTTSECPP